MCVSVCVRVCISTHTHTPRILYICSSVDGHLDCCHVLAIVNKAAINFGRVRVSFWITVFVYFRYIPRVDFLNQTVVTFRFFLRNLCTVFRSGSTDLHSHQPSAWGFFTAWPTLSSPLFEDSHFDRCEVTSCCGFDLHFDWWCWASFHVPLHVWVSSLGKCLFESSPQFLFRLFVCSWVVWMYFVY